MLHLSNPVGPAVSFFRWACALFLAASASIAMAAPSTQLQDNRWEQLVFPALTNSYTVQDLLGDDLPPDGYGSDWVLFTYNRNSGGYDNPGLNGTIDAGTAFWILQRTGRTVTIDIPDNVDEFLGDVSNACRSEYGCLEKSLPTETGSNVWHMLGSPFPDTLDLGTVSFVSSSNSGTCGQQSGCDLSDAASAGLVAGTLFYYSSSSGEYESASESSSLQPWQGFWFRTNSNSQGSDVGILLPDPRLCLPNS